MIDKRLALNLASLFLLYFVQGMPYGLQSRYLPIVMRLRGTSLSELGLLKLLLVPWLLKFFISAFVVDAYKSKRFWLVLSMLVLSTGSFLCSIFTDIYSISVIMFILNLASAVQDISVDWFAINILDKENLGIGNTVQVSGYKAGTLFTGGFIVWFIDYIDLTRAFFILGVVYFTSLLLLNLSLFNIEKSSESDKASPKKMLEVSAMQRFSLIFGRVFLVPGTLWMCCFVLVYKLGIN
jgi:hypothetical protein